MCWWTVVSRRSTSTLTTPTWHRNSASSKKPIRSLTGVKFFIRILSGFLGTRGATSKMSLIMVILTTSKGYFLVPLRYKLDCGLWTVDWTVDNGLDCGLDHGLDYRYSRVGPLVNLLGLDCRTHTLGWHWAEGT